MSFGFRATIVRAAKLRGRLLPVVTMEGRSLEKIRADWVGIVLVEWDSEKATETYSVHLVEFRGADGELLDFLHFGSLDVALDQARAVTGLHPDRWRACEVGLPEDPEIRMTWRELVSRAGF